jgi:hypothetical protein
VRAEFEEVMLLQMEYSATNTEAMRRRGELVRHVIPSLLKPWLESLSLAARIEGLQVEGGDGIGRKAEIPWVRVFSPRRSPRATQGWYLVYLFSALGDRVYLTLNQGTRLPGGDAARPPSELRNHVDWAISALDLEQGALAPWRRMISLDARTDTGRGYEVGNVIAREYLLDGLPPIEDLIEDLRQAAEWLGELYRVVDIQWDNGVPASPELVEARAGMDAIAGRKPRRWGPRLSATERKEIELRAVAVATAHLERLGFDVVDVGAWESFDLLARRGTETLFVEVKGTTSSGASVVLTRNEVALHREVFPSNALMVVSGICLANAGGEPVASGGVLRILWPWEVEDNRLTPVAFEYLTGLEG